MHPAVRRWRNATRTFLLALTGLGCATPALSATVYKCIDKEGRVEYTNMPCPGGVRMEIPTEIVVPTPGVPQKPDAGEAGPKEAGAPAPAFAGYTGLAVQEPGKDEAVRDNSGQGTVPVALSIAPALRADLGHRVAVYVDGSVWPTRFSGPRFTLEGVGPGTHTLRAAVVGADGSELFSSGTTKFSLLRVTKLTPKGPDGGPPVPDPMGEPQPGTEGMPRMPRPPIPEPGTLPPLPAR